MQHTTLDQRIKAIEAGGEPVRKYFAATVDAKAIDDEKRTVPFVITTGSVDRDNDKVAPAGWECAEFLRNPVVLWAHDYSQLPVARALDITASAEGLRSTALFPPKGVYEFADTVFELCKLGILNASSVGFRPVEYERDDVRGGINFTRQSLLEWSIVPVPANAEALVVARRAGVDIAPLRRWVKGALALISGEAKAVRRRKDMAAPELAARLATLDGFIDAADAVCDSLMADLGVPDDNSAFAATDGSATPAGGETVMPSAQVGAGAAGGDTSTGDAMRAARKAPAPIGAPTGQVVDNSTNVPPPGQAPAGSESRICPACQGQIVDGRCVGCGWTAPDALAPVNGEPYPERAADPLRWNRKLSKAFDVAGEPAEPGKLEISWAARFLGVPVQELSVECFSIPSARMGSHLAALDERLADFKVEAIRNITYAGREDPPKYESVQLNSRITRSYLVEGSRFLTRGDGLKMIQKLEPQWFGLEVTHYVRHGDAAARTEWVRGWQARAAQLNYLRGECFTLSGEFLDRGAADWSALFLSPPDETVLRRAVDRVNADGEDMDSRGLLLMGPPGTGKTLAGRVMMAQADATFIWVSARDFYRSGAFGAFTYAYDLAKECAPTVLFFEDCDNWLGSDTIDLLKTEMDGLSQHRGVLTVLTTNFPQLLPDALIDRPGRFHDLLELALPDEAVRMRMLASWAPAADAESVAAIARATEGYSGAHLRELATFAATVAAEEKLAPGAALSRALEKLKEQRDLVAALRESPDYRPRRQVRMAVMASLALVAKRGRVLSGANERLLRDAHGSIGTVLQQLAKDDEVPAGGEEMALALDDAPADADVELAFEDDAPEPEMVVDGAVLQEAILAVLTDEIRDQARRAVARATGRVD